MSSQERKSFEEVAADAAKYKALAQPALRDKALEKMFNAARKAAIVAFATLDADEKEAFENALGTQFAPALTKGVTLAFGIEKLVLS